MKCGSVVVVKQVLRAKQYLWACGFAGMAVLLNPIAPIFTPAGNLMFLLFLIGIAPMVRTLVSMIDTSFTLYPNVITEPYLQSELLIPTPEWAVV
jgi:hypothetical protein